MLLGETPGGQRGTAVSQSMVVPKNRLDVLLVMKRISEDPPRPVADVEPRGMNSGAFWQFAAGGLVVGGIIIAADLGWLTSVSRWVHALPLGDKLVHALAMGGLCGLADRAFPSRTLGRPFGWLRLTPLIVTLVVIGEEISQRWIPGRNFDLGDLAADLLGIGVVLWWRRQRAGLR